MSTPLTTRRGSFSRRSGLVVAFPVLCLLVACGTATQETSETGTSAATAPGCESKVGTIVESDEFTPWEQRRSNPDVSTKSVISDLGSALVSDGRYPQSLDGLAAAGAMGGGDYPLVAYAESSLVGSSPTRALSDGALFLSIGPTDVAGDLFEQMRAMIGDRVVAVQVGDTQGVLTWADPDANGVRPHVVTWVDAGQEYVVKGVREPEELVSVAREVAC